MTKTLNVRVEEFERALSGDGRAAIDPTMKALVAVAGALAAIPTQPSAPFKESLRTKLMAEAAQLAAAPAAAPAAPQVPVQAGPLKALPKALAKPAMQVATGGLAATIAVTGLGVGASRSLPGDSLYGLKRTVERLQDRTSGGTLAEAGSVLEHAQTRVDEIVALLERDGAGAVAQVERTLADLKAELDKVTADLLAQAQAGSRAAYEKLDATVTSMRAELDALRGTLPPEAQDELGAVMETLNGAAGVLGSLPKPPGVPTGGTPTVTPTTPPPTSVRPTTPPPTSTKPATTPPTSPSSTSPSTPTTTGPIIKPPTTPPVVITTPPLPTLPVTLPPVLP